MTFVVTANPANGATWTYANLDSALDTAKIFLELNLVTSVTINKGDDHE